MITKEELAKLKVGSKVKSDFYEKEKDLVREIISIEITNETDSGYKVIISGGDTCNCCNRQLGTIIEGYYKKGVDGYWITEIVEV